jgi:hypothetical protein
MGGKGSDYVKWMERWLGTFEWFLVRLVLLILLLIELGHLVITRWRDIAR